MAAIYVNGHKANFCLDSGSQADLITDNEYNKMQPKPVLFPSDHKLWPYNAQTPMKTLGQFPATVRATSDGRTLSTDVHVVEVKGRACNLLSKSTCKALGLITVNLPSEPQVNSISNEPDVKALISEYDDICHGIGCHKDQVISLPIDPNVKPVACPPGRIPVHLLPAIKTELDRLKSQGVVEDVPVDNNTQWVSRMVPVPRKIEGSKVPGIRITIDLRNVNKGLQQVHHHMPTIEQMRYDLNGATCFSHLDMADAFYQYPLNIDSRELTTFSTPWSLKRLTRLPQGAKPSSAILHEAIRRDLEGLQNVLNVADNVLVWGTGATWEEARVSHFHVLKAVLELFRRKGLTLNKSKCILEARSIQFFGYIFSSEGISPDPEKVTALRDATPPSSKEDVHSFLGMTGWNQQFIPSYATISEPLRRLTTKSAKFIRGPDQRKAFQTLKEALIKTALLSYFDPKKKTVLITDASPVGVNATLCQEEKGSLRPLSFASHALNTTEQKYNQLEREAVAMQFGCHRFRLFLLGAPFDHFIDPITLKPMMENPRKEAPARIEHIRLKLQGYDAKIKLIKGSENPTDYLSRHPLPYSTCSPEEKRNAADVENHIFYVAQFLPKAITTDRIRAAISDDQTLIELRQLIQDQRDPSTLTETQKLKLKSFLHVWRELSIVKQLILWGGRFVLPKALINDAIELSHSGHQGISKSKQYLRTSLWFPDMDKLVEERVNKCIPCQAATPLTKSQPLQMSKLPPEPWQVLAAALFGPLPTGEKILVVKCLRSKWPEIKVILRKAQSVHKSRYNHPRYGANVRCIWHPR